MRSTLQPLLALIAMLSLLAFTTAADAQETTRVYKKVNPDGSITFTDEPPDEGAEAIDVQEVQTVPAGQPFQRPQATADQPQVIETRYADFRITRPTNEETFWNIGATLQVTVAMQDALKEGHMIRFLFNGTPVTQSRDRSVVLSEVFRGQHTLQAQIVDNNGQTLASAGPVTFFVHQTSIQQNRRRRN